MLRWLEARLLLLLVTVSCFGVCIIVNIGKFICTIITV